MIIKNDRSQFEDYLSDASNYHGDAQALYLPENEEDVISIFKECTQNSKNISFYGAGTGLTGAAIPFDGVQISTEKLNRIIEISTEKKYAIVQPGCTLAELEETLGRASYFYPPNPTERNSSLGGNVATNASGARTFKYGATRDNIIELNIILANGEKLRLIRGENIAENNLLRFTTGKNEYHINIPEIKMPNVKHAAGYYLKKGMDATDLFIGSEGTLGFVSQIKLKILPEPENIIGLAIFFEDEQRLLRFVNNTIEISRDNENLVSPRLVEFFDNNSLNLLKNKYVNIPDNAKGAIWIEQECSFDDENAILEVWYKHSSNYTNLTDDIWAALDKKTHNLFREFRHELPLKVSEIITRNKRRKVATDTAVPKNYFFDHFNFIRNELNNTNIENAIWGHIGNCHFHANLFPLNDEHDAEALEIYRRIIDNSLQCGGTVSAEHGIGKLKKKYLRMMFGDKGINEMKKIKDLLDPMNILSRGNLF